MITGHRKISIYASQLKLQLLLLINCNQCQREIDRKISYYAIAV